MILRRIPYRTNFYKTAREAIAGITSPCCTIDAGSLVSYNKETGMSMAIAPGTQETVFADIPWSCLSRVECDRND